MEPDDPKPVSLGEFLANQPAPQPVEGAAARPVNEAPDAELCDQLTFVYDNVVCRVDAQWAGSLGATQRVLAEAEGLSPALLELRLAAPWFGLNKRLRELADHPVVKANLWMEVIRSQLHMRLRDLRSKGILPGDPREDKVLAQSYPPPGESPRG